MKKIQRKQTSGSGEDEVDNCVGIRGDLKNIDLIEGHAIVSNVDSVNCIESRCNDTCTEKSEQTGNLLGNIKRNRDDKSSEYHQQYPFTALLFIGSIGSSLLFVIDLVFDILLAMGYRDNGRILECALTSSVSFLVTGTLSTIWYIQDVHGPKYRMNKTLFLVLAFPFSIIIRNLSYVKHGLLSRKSCSDERKKLKHYQQMVNDDRDASLLRMFDAFIESGPQLIIQIYIALQDKPEESLYLEILRCFKIASSLASVSWSVTSYYRNLRIFSATSDLKANTLCGAVGYFLWRVFEIGPRITAIVMLLSVDTHGLYIIFGSLFHWFIMLTMAFLMDVKVYDNFVHNIMFIVLIGLVQIISYMNLSHKSSRLLAFAYYAIFYVENAVMVLLFVLWTDIDKSIWIFLVTVCVASSGTLFCTLFMGMYYRLCHPKMSRPSEDVTADVE